MMRGHVRQRAPGKWAIVLDVGRDAETSKRKQKWFSGYRTKSAAEEALVELLGKKHKGETIDPDMTMLADYLTTWIDGRTDELAPLSVTQYRSVVRNHVAKTPLGGMPLGKIRRAHVRAHEQELQRKGLSASTCNVVRAVLSRALADAVEDDLISTDPCAGRRRSGERRSEPKRFTVWTGEELRTLLEAADGDRLEALWRVAVATGARRGELLGLTWFGFSAEEGTLSISQQVVPTRGGPSIHPCKTKGSHRTIRLDAETVKALEAHRETQLLDRELAADAYEDRDLIFADELGGIINPQRLTEKFAALRETAGIRRGRLHDVRHTAATHLLTRGVPVHIVSARLGHSSPMVTLSVYAHVLPTGDEQAADVMAGVLVSKAFAETAQTRLLSGSG
jgi:integrase